MNSRLLMPHFLETLLEPSRACCCHRIINTFKSFNTQKTSSPSLSRMFCVESSHFSAYRHAHHPFPHTRWLYSESLLPTRMTQPLLRCRCFSSSFSADEGGSNINMTLKKKPGKVRTFFVCENCGESYGQWWGKCNSCKMQGSLKKFSQRLTDEGGGAGLRAAEGVALGDPPQGPVPPTKEDCIVKPQLGRPLLKVGSVLGPQRLTDVLKGISESQWRMPL